MFGGLEIKDKATGGGGSVSGTSQDGGEPSAPAPAPVAGSAFGFMNSTAATTTTTSSSTGPAADAIPDAAPAAAVSSFSFLNSTAPSTDATEGTAPAPAATETGGVGGGGASGFSFMQELSAPPPAAPGATDEIAKHDTPAPTAATSGFSFMMPSASTDAADETPAVTAPAPTVESSAPATSGFSFLSSPSPAATDAVAPEPEGEDAGGALELLTGGTRPPTAVHARTTSIGSNASSITNDLTSQPPNVLESAALSTPAAFPTASPTPPGLPTGAGVTFGTSSVKRNFVKKKSRAQRVGAGAAAAKIPTPPQSMAQNVPASTATSAPPYDSKSARDEAAEAQRRAEEFIKAKERHEAAEAEAKPATSSSPSPPAIQPATSTDEVLAAAQAAAEEAKIMQQKQHKVGGGGFMGTFFKGFGAGSATSRASPNTTAPTSNDIHHGSATEPASSNGVDRLAKEQEGMQRAMAERQMQIQKSIPSTDDDDDDDDNVVVSTSVGGYRPDLVAESQASSSRVSSFTPATIPTKTAEDSGIAAPTSTGVKISSVFSPPKPPAAPVIPSQQPISVQKSKTPTMIFEEYQLMFAESVKRAMGQVENVRSQQKMLTEERFVSIAKDRLATQQIAQAESQLQTAVEEENYELADQLGQVIDGHKREKQEVALMLENIAKALEQLDSQKSLVVKSVAACFHNLTHRLLELKEKEAAAEQKDDEETLKQFASISKQLSAEQERLSQDFKHLERDETLVAEERKELEDSISEQTGEIETRKEEATQKLKEAEDEIAELRKLLEIKQKEAADLRTEMFGFEDAISKVRVKFSRQLTRVDKKERALKESRSEWEAEDSAHKKQKEAHELQVQSHSEALLAHDALVKSLESELKLSTEFSDLIPKQLGFNDDVKVDGTDEDEGSNDENDLAQLQADVVKCEAAVSEAKILLKAATSALESLQAEHDSLVASIPRLEEQKKAAAASRDFKAAGKASKDIKDATARIKECEEELNGESSSRKISAEEKLKKLDSELAEAREIAQAKEKVSGLERMASLATQIGKLVETKKEVCGDHISEENSVRAVGALALDAQISALKSEGQDIGAKYGGWNELMKQYGLDEPEPEDTKDVSAETAQSEVPKPRPDDGLTSKERISKVRKLMERLTVAEAGMETAAEKEDFEEAALHQETLESIQKEIEEMNLTDEEVELAMSDEPLEEEAEETTPEKEIQETASVTEKPIDADEEDKKSLHDQNDDESATQDSEDKKSRDDEASDEEPEVTTGEEEPGADTVTVTVEEDNTVETEDDAADQQTVDSKSIDLSTGDDGAMEAEKKEDPSSVDE
mmetsp:Transcript_11503/g.27506  ORF Transcript_11503/g.27506 Transcript_11503/m.27506 type:complete len:1324 (-) Transcript_11503:44-4015(-)